MNRYLLFLLVLIILMVVPVSANTALSFQQQEDFTVRSESITSEWIRNTSGGNNFVRGIAGIGDTVVELMSAPPGAPMTYAAFTTTSTGVRDVYVKFFNSNYLPIGVAVQLVTTMPSRIEVKIFDGGVVKYYVNGAHQNNQIVATNPSYVAFTANTVDDAIWGSSQPLLDNASDKYIYGVPEIGSDGSFYYYIMKDFTNPAASGFYASNGTLLYSYAMSTTFSKCNGNNDTMELQSLGGGLSVITAYTGNVYTGSNTWDLTAFFAANPNYGLYSVHSPSSLIYSDPILYIGNGATISWDKTSYAVEETAQITYAVSSGAYWNTAIYDYRIDVLDIYGTVINTYPVTIQSSTISHQWADDDNLGVYYAAIIARPKTGTTTADDIWMNAAITNVDAYLNINGYVFDAETENPITGALVNVTQGLDSYLTTTVADGNYTATGLSSGATVTINAGKSGYETYLHQFTPLRAGNLEINITLMPTNPAHSGIALGGIARSPPYNRTINNALVTIQNASAPYGNYTVLTNSVGYYIKDYMPNNYWWNIWGSKTGFSNSSIYQKLVVGA